MTNHGILIKKSVAAQDVLAYNRYAMAGSAVDLDDGNVFRLDTQNTAATSGYEEVWDVSQASASASTLNGLWMAGAFGVNTLSDGTHSYRGLSDDPRQFYNPGAKVFDAFKPQPGDVIELSADAFSNAISGSTYANSADASYELAFGAAQVASSLSFKVLATTYISIGTGAIDNQRVTAYKLHCLAN
jgi:hypothetical protein